MKKFALVIGASGAIGSAIVKRLAKDGWSLYLHYFRGRKKVDQLMKELTAAYPQSEFIPVQADFSVDGGAEQLANQIFSVQAVIFAGGTAYYGLLEDTPASIIDKLWKEHVQNPIRLVALLSKKLRQNGSGYIMFIGSIWGEAGAAYETVYATVKGAQHAFVKAYAKEAASQRILVNAIAPGIINTDMNSHLLEEEKQAIYDEIPLHRPGEPEEVANLVSFYISGQADYVTGQIIRLNGGWYI
ncbi:SDR family oxidoreductase [Ureibacillus sp. FSL W7-1570]|uniref:elongation factor P 5-aminopentanone reductase n=1 Tax=Ureibacillus sp. FSL W7-1570 TaxID=2954593 RepID=UPI003159D521